VLLWSQDGSSKYDDVTMRVLCPVSLVGAMIGRKGENIRKLKRESNADIMIEDFVPGSDERVIKISLCKDSPLHTPNSAGDALVAVVDSLCENNRVELQAAGMSSEDERSSSAVSMDRDVDMQIADDAMALEDLCEVRVLVDTSQVGYLVGKSGATIKATMEESGAQVRIMPKGELPTCAWVSDEMIQIAGTRAAVTCAVRRLAFQLEQHPPRIRGSQRPMLLAHASTGDLQYLQNSSSKSCIDYTRSVFPGAANMSVDTVFRLLVPADRAGNIIGRGGDHIQRIRQETGSRIKVYGSADDVEERLICVYSSEDANSQYCAAQDALVRCAISLSPDESSSRNNIVRLLAPQVSIGAVLGRKGATVMQLRQETGASIRVLTVEAPLAAASAVAIGGGEPGGDEIIHIEGALHQCIAALRGVATLLRGWQIRRAITATPRAVTTITLAPGLLAQSLAMGAASGGLVAVPVTAHGAGSPAAYATVAHGSFPTSPPVLWRYRLTNLQAGAVIGKSGHHVSQIRQLTGTRVHLPTGQSPDGLRTLEISGPEESCQAAHTLVNQFLALGKCPPAMPEHQSSAMVFIEESEISPDCEFSPGQWSPHDSINSEDGFE
jgi:transcription antitermination factor NusA-like protein